MRIDFLLLMILLQLFFRKTSTAFEIENEKCRSLVCVVCYQKASRSLSQLEIKNVQDYLIDGYSSSNPDFLNGICTGCSIALSKKRKDPTIALPIVENYDPERKTGMRSLYSCTCKVCSVAKLNGLNVLLASRKNCKKRGRPSTKTIPEHVKVCANCFTKIYRGCSHSVTQCQNSRRIKVSNLMKFQAQPRFNVQRRMTELLLRYRLLHLVDQKKQKG